MRKLWIFAAVAALALTACQQEKDIQEGASRGENNVSFVLQNGASTRSGGTVGLVERGEIIPVAKIGNYEIFLEETIQDLNACGAETRGTPVYTENLGYLFRDKLGVHTSTYSTRDVVYQQYNDTMIEDTEGKYWCYGYEYPTNIWGNGVTPVDFALYMPYDMTNNGVTPTFNGPKTTFTYVSPRRRRQHKTLSSEVSASASRTIKRISRNKAGRRSRSTTLSPASSSLSPIPTRPRRTNQIPMRWNSTSRLRRSPSRASQTVVAARSILLPAPSRGRPPRRKTISSPRNTEPRI